MQQTKNLFNKKPSSYWRQSAEMPSYPPLEQDLQTEVLVIGAGIAGITTAYELSKRGKQVVLIEGRELISGTTGYTTSKLTAQHDIIYHGLIQRYGEDIARRYYQANTEAIDYVKSTAEANQIDCEFEKQAAYVYTQQEDGAEILSKEAEAYRTLGIDGYLTKEMPLDIPIEAAIVMQHQAQFHPVKYLIGLLRAFENNGGTIYEQTLAMELENGDKVKVKTESDYTITADHVITATHFPLQSENKFFSSHMNPKNSYGIAIKSKNAYPSGMYISLEAPKRSIRSLKQGEDHYILVGGEAHVTGDGTSVLDRYERIYQFADAQFGVEELYEHWSSHDLITLDQLPFIGRVSEDESNVYTATGFGKWGLSNGVAAASIIADQIEGVRNPYEDIFATSREVKEAEPINLGQDDVASISNETVTKPEDLKQGQGAVLELDGKSTACYRDHDGKLHLLSTVCTHNGCPVAWNNADETWDCSCHGSRFSAIGEVREGPAITPLEKAQQ